MGEVPGRFREAERRGALLKVPDGSHFNETGRRVRCGLLSEAVAEGWIPEGRQGRSALKPWRRGAP